ncbi:hypothetical protein GPECTOR_64g127 [Gonium pectorale]|uniref:Protein FAM221A n=1 Tax=Gonium pectorale TaxID=33097 RepID=A0A150G4C7_GONPE|nr:hypothetical protein GPECTOR_64g127 [Gonium pectorale]|eukprot:KXZ44633.1 hypothetical protein GPECTOR_64g127 [Gonium pectorale]
MSDAGTPSKASALAALKARRQNQVISTGDTGGAAASATPAAAEAGPSAAAPEPPHPEPLPTKTVEAFAWTCNTCARECVPVRSESRCLCGHRLREHEPASTSAASRCKAARCACKGFFFVVAEGAWVLRCRCKHKHTEHNPATRACAKAGCSCGAFDSPWVCNCDHPWADHTQAVQLKQVVSVRDMMGGLSLAEMGGGGPAREVNDYDGLKRGGLGG